ncbi:MAG TPA: hypothetical protein VLN25_10760, partial [Burkholderiaceae bacterium]|nr:hypothetical protein [Burkholderiaceae bacterium]
MTVSGGTVAAPGTTGGGWGEGVDGIAGKIGAAGGNVAPGAVATGGDASAPGRGRTSAYPTGATGV